MVMGKKNGPSNGVQIRCLSNGPDRACAVLGLATLIRYGAGAAVAVSLDSMHLPPRQVERQRLKKKEGARVCS